MRLEYRVFTQTSPTSTDVMADCPLDKSDHCYGPQSLHLRGEGQVTVQVVPSGLDIQ